MAVPGFRGCLEAGAFDSLTSFRMHACPIQPSFLAHLFGAGSRLRTTLVDLAIDFRYGPSPAVLFAFSFHHFLPFEPLFYKYCFDDLDTVLEQRVSDDWATPALIADEILAPAEVLPQVTQTRLGTNFDNFFDTVRAIVMHPERNCEEFVRAKPPAKFPFSSLVSLSYEFSLGLGDEIFAFFCTDLFPSLKHLTLIGPVAMFHMLQPPHQQHPLVRLSRQATYHSSRSEPIRPAQLFHNNLEALGLPFRPQWSAPNWQRLTADEAASDEFASYKGPRLETLDLSRVAIFWPEEV
ncbi:hypothetical protein JCM10213v2_000083 [Rhodosporidiobolus nylandii]